MLTKTERELVIDKLRHYPAGVPSNAWGYGPLEKPSRYGDFKEPSEVKDLSTLQKYG